MPTFETMFDRLLDAEGGYTDGHGDPGGETKYGISKRSYPALDIKNLTRDQAQAIYRTDFWARIDADRLPPAVAFQVFDFAVNSGIETAVRYLQRALGVADDGHYGPVTAAAAAAIPPLRLIVSLDAERLDFLTRLSNWPIAGRAWGRRIAQDLRYSVADTQ